VKKSKRELKEIKKAEEEGDMWRRYDYSFANFLAQHSTADEVKQAGSEIFNSDPDFSGTSEKSTMSNKISITISKEKKLNETQDEYLSKNFSSDFHLKIEEKSLLKPYLDFLEDFEKDYERINPLEPDLDLLENFNEDFKKNPSEPNSEFIDRFDKEFEDYNPFNNLESWLPDKFEWEVNPFKNPDEWLALVKNNKQIKEKAVVNKEETKQSHFPESTIQQMQKSSSELKEKGNIKQNLDVKNKINENNNQITHEN